MNALLKNAIAVAAVAIASQVAAQVTFYEQDGFQGRSFTTERPVADFGRYGFNDRASSAEVVSGPWEVCEDLRFSGRCVVLRPGRYPSLATMGLNNRISSVRAMNRDARVNDQRYAPAPVAPQVTFYEREGFGGRSFTTDRPVENFRRYGFNDRASAVEVVGEPWEVCEDVRFSGRCVVLRPGRYPSLATMGLNDRISSVRAVNRNARIEDPRNPPAPLAAPDYRRRNGERLHEVNVTSVRAVLGSPEHRCWVEREQVAQDRNNANVPGAIAGAIIGGILGHQVGGGTGKDLATAGGVVAGAAVGANIGRDGGTQQTATQDVQRCESVPSQARPQYWDVTYNFRGQEHRIQMTTPPGPTVTVNEQGEPRH
ncbi:beta/gamma crystallin-related protein [Rhodoferax sp. UBA5149]|uniref:beta/gamma crystallin-related protein n=1 Tax=Rhodoferax sp. UBA5149 TaxID=1947379 RepID=UPI0025CE4CCB|nr:beta/gamma crystallin-related protein [Rhodoferax sp. UBA5149]